MPKSVLYIDNTLTYGGAILSLKNLLKALDRHKFVPVVTTGQPEEYLRKDYADVKCYSLKIKLPWIHNGIYQKALGLKIAKFSLLKKLISLCRFCYWVTFHHLPDAIRYFLIGKRNNVKLIHLNNILGSQLSGILAAKMLRIPCVAHLRDFENNSIFTRTYGRLIDHHIAISSAIRANLLELGIPGDKISTVHDSLDINEFNPDIDNTDANKEFELNSDCLKFGLFGRIVEWKGVREFVAASAQVLKQHDNAVAFVVGNASDPEDKYFKEVLRLIEELELQDKIIMTGYRMDVPELMAFMDVIVHASITAEPFGMVVIEGMALGKPVVATAAGGPLDIVVDGETGLLVPPGDVEELAAAISTLLSDRPQMRRMGKLARKRVETMFSNDESARKVERIYERLLMLKAHEIKEKNVMES